LKWIGHPSFRHVTSSSFGTGIIADLLQTVAPYLSTFRLDSNATYVVTGGLGGIGLRIAQWLCSKGAANLILVSRSGLSRNPKAQKIVSALTADGVSVDCPAIDIADRELMKNYFTKRQLTMPPIKGCIQSAMVLHDATLAKMTIDDWHQALAPKVKGTWNLHEVLPPMDFFILLSSIVGVGGNQGQANYAAGNTFEDEFARWRTTEYRRKTISLDLGFVVDAGVAAENDTLVSYFLRRKVVRPNRLVEIFALFERVCDPAFPISAAEQSQIITGLKLPSETVSEGGDVPPELLVPMFRVYQQVHAESTSSSRGASRLSLKTLFMAATSAEETETITSSALQAKLAQILGLPVEEVELDRPLNQYGMDSLVALEIQSWIRREVEAEIAIFEVLGEATVCSLSKAIVVNSKMARKYSSS
jgi:NAD(P)-dependent dehydrogenase (short-subunit alcohol dehydrogenase family)/aryl carrier-like protein